MHARIVVIIILLHHTCSIVYMKVGMYNTIKCILCSRWCFVILKTIPSESTCNNQSYEV